MTYNIDIFNEFGLDDPMLELVRAAVETTLAHLQFTSTSLSVLLTDDARLKELNREFRQIDSPTDVLSFPVNDQLPGEDGDVHYLGDIAISIPYAQRQAEKIGHLLAEELQLLSTHGVLHLAGYDHFSKEEKEEMWSAQENILIKLGLANIINSIA